ncbi:MAG: hypothetical protein IH872_01225 [Chloroflexi bacterium]|nr:hypothetical protein [Chloroflexota bacterium]
MHSNPAETTLRLFNEKADKLESLSFTSEIENSGIHISAGFGQPVRVERRGPDEEAIDAFVLTMRFFIQDNEPTSFKNMEDLYSELPVSTELKQRYSEARKKTNEKLDGLTMVTENRVEITYRYVFDVFLWGGLAHADSRKKIVYDRWAKHSVLFPMLQNEFVSAIGIVLEMIYFTRAINQAALTELALQS